MSFRKSYRTFFYRNKLVIVSIVESMHKRLTLEKDKHYWNSSSLTTSIESCAYPDSTVFRHKLNEDEVMIKRYSVTLYFILSIRERVFCIYLHFGMLPLVK